MIRVIVMFLIRKHLGLKKGERFQFSNQKSTVDRYYFTAATLRKEHAGIDGCYDRPANVKINYILSDMCKIQKCEKLSWC